MYVLCMYVPEDEDPVGARYYKSAYVCMYVCMQEAGAVGWHYIPLIRAAVYWQRAIERPQCGLGRLSKFRFAQIRVFADGSLPSLVRRSGRKRHGVWPNCGEGIGTLDASGPHDRFVIHYWPRLAQRWTRALPGEDVP